MTKKEVKRKEVEGKLSKKELVTLLSFLKKVANGKTTGYVLCAEFKEDVLSVSQFGYKVSLEDIDTLLHKVISTFHPEFELSSKEK